MHKLLKEIEFEPDWTTYNGVSCSCEVSTLSRLLLIRSFLNLQVTRTCITLDEWEGLVNESQKGETRMIVNNPIICVCDAKQTFELSMLSSEKVSR